MMAIVYNGTGWDEELTDIVTSNTTWKLYNLLLEHNATGKSTETSMTAWFLAIHKKVAIKYSEYD